MDLTPNIGLGKPLVGENYDIEVFNANADILDTMLSDHETRLDNYDIKLGLVPWTTYAATLKNGTTVVAGTTISYSRYMRIGKTVFCKGTASTGATACPNATILLPSGAGLVPTRRELGLGSVVIIGAAAPSQTGSGRMTADKEGLVALVSSGAFADMPANHDISWDVCYEVN